MLLVFKCTSRNETYHGNEIVLLRQFCNFLDLLEKEKGVKAFANFPKMMAAVEGIRGLSSYASNKYNLLISTKTDGSSFIASDEFFAEYK